MIKVNSQELQFALEAGGEVVSYLDLQTGEVISLPDSPDFPEDAATLKACKRAPKRFRRIMPIPPHDFYFLMQTWVESLPQGAPRRALERALAGKKPFATFENVLNDFPAEHTAWFAQKNDDLAYFAYRWLKKESIAAELA